MNEEFIKKILKLSGDSGKKWLHDLPQIIKRYEQKWDIEVLPPFTLSYNYVAPVKTSYGNSAVLKVSFPGNKEFTSEIGALKFFNGEGAIKILQEDLANGVVLLEKAEPGNPVRDIADDRHLISIVSEVIKKLHKPIGTNLPFPFPAITDWAMAFTKYKDKFSNTAGPVPKNLFDKAEGIVKEYTKDKKKTVLLHGDLHNDNILSSQRGWLVIDPKGVIGEPEFEMAAFLRNPYFDLPKGSDYKGVETRRILQFSEELGFDKERILNWAFVGSILSILWFLEDEYEFSDLYLQNAELLNPIKFYVAIHLTPPTRLKACA